MKIERFTSTKLKRNTAEVLNSVAYGKAVAIIERYGVPLVRIVPMVAEREEKNLDKALGRYFGIFPNFPRVSKLRYFRKKDLSL